MKKWLVLFLPILLVGCGPVKDLSNTPTRKVEAYLNKYQIADDSILTDVFDSITDLFNDITDLNDDEKDRYEKLMKKNYGDMTYEVKDETIDGDKALVTVEINVHDLAKVRKSADEYLSEHPDEFNDDGIFSTNLFHEYLFEHFEDSDIVTYTIQLSLTKKENGEWDLDDLTKEQKQKINGTYGM